MDFKQLVKYAFGDMNKEERVLVEEKVKTDSYYRTILELIYEQKEAEDINSISEFEKSLEKSKNQIDHAIGSEPKILFNEPYDVKSDKDVNER